MNTKKLFYLLLICCLLLLSVNYFDNREEHMNKMKIISISSAATEILYSIDADEYLIGVSSYCNYPKDVINKKKIGSFEAPDIESIFINEPDIVFLDSGVQIYIISQLQNLGIKVISLDAKTFDDILQNITIIGQITSKEQNAFKICKEMNDMCTDLCFKIKYCDCRPSVFFEVWDNPLMCAGSETFIYNIILLSGAKNIIDLNITGYSRYNIEKLIGNNPQIYIINSHSYDTENLIERIGYIKIQAIINNEVYVIDENIISRAGPRIIYGLYQISQIVHPEIFF